MLRSVKVWKVDMCKLLEGFWAKVLVPEDTLRTILEVSLWGLNDVAETWSMMEVPPLLELASDKYVARLEPEGACVL